MSRTLISGYLERISSKIFDDYHEVITHLVGNQRGVYALYKKNSLYYVGLATNLRMRVKQHLKDRHSKKWDGFSLYLIHNADHLRELETLLIRISEPRGNRTKGGFRKSENLIPALKEMMEERNREQVKSILDGRSRIPPKKKPGKLKLGKSRAIKLGDPPIQGLLPPGSTLRANYKGKENTAEADPQGKIHLDDKIFNSPSYAASHITGRPMNGWTFWKYQTLSGEWEKIDHLRKKD